mmetsp:Transcript_103151/g.204913  ORF Transcript_103151/g.204913 Transcript_103151/m.204913 type:complete len:224 (-) Transcript_103151:108-779(-)
MWKFHFICLVLPAALVSGQSDIAVRGGGELSLGGDDYFGDERIDTEYGFDEGDRFIKLTFDMKDWFPSNPKALEGQISVVITPTSLAHGLKAERRLSFTEELKYPAIPEESTWEIKTTKKGARNLVVKIKKAREGQDWGDCCKDYPGEGSSDPKPLVEKKKKEKKSKPEKASDDREDRDRRESKEDYAWIVALSVSMGVLGLGIGLGLACGGFVSGKQRKKIR